MGHGKYAKNGKDDKPNKAKLYKNRLEKEVELEKQKADEAKESGTTFETGEVRIVSDDDLRDSSDKELSMKEKIYRSLEESTRQIEQEQDDEIKSEPRDLHYDKLVDRIDELEDDRIRKKIDKLSGLVDDDDLDDDDEDDGNHDEEVEELVEDISNLRSRANSYNKAKKKKERLEEKAQEKMARRKK